METSRMYLIPNAERTCDIFSKIPVAKQHDEATCGISPSPNVTTEKLAPPPHT